MTRSQQTHPTRRAAILGSLGAAVLGASGMTPPPDAAGSPRPHAAGAGPTAPQPTKDETFPLFTSGSSGTYECYRIPAVVTTPEGTTIAFAEARRDADGEKFCFDDGSIDIVAKRSTNGGKDWDPQKVILTGNPWGGDAKATRGNPVPIVLQRGDNAGRIVLLTTWNAAGDRTKRIPFVMWSDDDGKGWSTPISLEKQLKGGDNAPDKGWYATGPQHGIQLAHGDHAGRLVAGVNYQGGNGAIIFSDDDGKTWKQGQGIPRPDGTDHFSEVGVEETADGTLIAIGRIHDDDEKSTARSRAVARSTDGGETFETDTFQIVKDLKTTPGVQGALLNRDGHTGKPGDRLLYSAPTDVEERRDLKVFASEDAGDSWTVSIAPKTVRAGYSGMTMLDSDVLGLLHEAGDEGGDARDRIDWHRIALS